MSSRTIITLFLGLLLSCGCGEKQQSVGPGEGNDNNDEEVECRRARDCPDLHRCEDNECVPGPCLDGTRSAGETDVDCGGDTCPACGTGKGCFDFTDCQTGACIEGICGGASPNNENNENDAPAECDDPGDAERFVAWPEAGLNVDVRPGPNTRGAGPVVTSGIAAFDADRDDDVDLMISNNGGEVRLYTNEGDGTFLDATAVAGIEGLTHSSSLSVADFDGDGDPDVIVGRTEGGAYLLVNQGDGTFTEESEAWGVGQDEDVVSGGSFADFDGDGDLDFYMGNYLPPIEITFPFEFPASVPNRLYRNDGDRFFRFSPDATPGGGAEDAGSTLAVAWWDYDADGRPDLWSSNDFGMFQTPSQLWRNEGPDPDDPDAWLFEDVSEETGVGVKIFGMSASLADFDNDGDQDGYAANMASNVLHVLEDGTTRDEANARGVACSVVTDPNPRPLTPPDYTPNGAEGIEEFLDTYADAESGLYTLTSWASIFFDANHDGWQDLFVVNGTTLSDFTPEATHQPNALFLNNGDGTYREAECWQLPDIRGTSRGAAVADLDGDGDLDIVFADQGTYGDSGVHVLRNEMATGNWLIVELRGIAPNTDAIGARVALTSGGMTQVRWIDGGQGFLSVSERIAHFGLGTEDAVDTLEITWPDGSNQTVTVDAVNQRIVVEQTMM